MVGEDDGWLYLLEVKNFSTDEIESMTSYRYSVLTSSPNNPQDLHLTKLNPNYPPKTGTFAPADHPCRIIAISPGGKVGWEYPFTINLTSWNTGHWTWLYYWYNFDNKSGDNYFLGDPVSVDARNGRVYVYHDYTEDVLDSSGQLLFSLTNVAGPAAVDEDGRIYTVEAARPGEIINMSTLAGPGNAAESPAWMTGQHYGEDVTRMLADPDYRIPSGIADAYDQDGDLLWSTDLGERVAGKYVTSEAWDQYHTLPLYANDTLYLPIVDGIAALARDGQIKWVRHIVPGHSSLFEMMPVDDKGNVYTNTYMNGMTYISVTSPAGMSSHEAVKLPVSSFLHFGALASSDGTIYTLGYGTYDYPNWTAADDDGSWSKVYALDIASGTEKWNFSAQPEDAHTVIIDEGNLEQIVPGPYEQTREQNKNGTLYNGQPLDVFVSMYGMPVVHVYPGDGIVYVDYYDNRCEYPIIFNRSRCTYVKELYALDEDGQILWSKPMDSFIKTAAANNSTIFYGTGDGRLGSGTTNVVAGLAVIATAYLFLRFLLFGSVARARSRLDKNENRTAVLQYVAGRPGVTAVEIAKDTRLNLGTVRYHLFILAANHKIVTHKEDGKFVRYFTNGNSYTGEERTIVSLLRRGPVRKALKTLLDRPGLSNLELSRELGISAASAHKQINELLDRGLVNKVPNDEGGFNYFIREERCEQIRKMMDRT
jgi:predicted transcriptional regulator